MKPPMPYAGGKQRVATAIANLLPPHRHYVEPFAGALSVLLAKPVSPLETVNDINGDIVTFWRVLRDRPAELERMCALTPHSRAELRASQKAEPTDELERAWRVWVQLTQCRGASLDARKSSGWRYIQGGGNKLSLARYLDGYLARIAPAADRLRQVSLECRDAFDVIAEYGRPDACLYVDPPYLAATRNSRVYRHEMGDQESHERLLTALLATPAAVVLSGYASPLYDEALTGWQRHEFAAVDQRGNARREVVWINRSSTSDLLTEESA